MQKAAGVLMPVASLPSRDGVGSFGKEAFKFVDILCKMGVGIWQILPLNPLGYGNSPYQPYSSYAGDPIYIDLDGLASIGLLPARRPACPDSHRERINYDQARAFKEPYLRQAFDVFCSRCAADEDFQQFCQMPWLRPYAVFIALKKQNDQQCWNDWPREQQDWILDKKYDISHLQQEIDYQIFLQYMFYTQWLALKSYANGKGIQIMGDVPFYVGQDSSDVWENRDCFLLDQQYRPSFVAGVPPDYFSPTGQRWGNPIYNWEIIEKRDFTFWINRLKYSSKLYDIIRIDHFRAFDTYWKINATCDTAIDGQWVEAPGYAFFDALYKQVPQIQIVAEDLGDIRPEVLQLRDHYDLMGMYVAEFSLPHSDNVQPHQLIYTGTHDNQTVRGWYQTVEKGDQVRIRRFLSKYGKTHEPISKKMVRYVYGSCAQLAIVPLADILGLDDQARLNTPGTVGSPNWEWRMADFTRCNRQIAWVRDILDRSGRS